MDYRVLVEEALRGVMIQALRQVEHHGLSGEHHFFITFRTDYPGTGISKDLKARYPEEITIVLQNQFWGLRTDSSGFSVSLSFSRKPQTLRIPYDAVTSFVDPSVSFALRFDSHGESADEQIESPGSGSVGVEPVAVKSPDETSKVISLDAFRKK